MKSRGKNVIISALSFYLLGPSSSLITGGMLVTYIYYFVSAFNRLTKKDAGI